jgi:hypothetical protein
MPTWITTFGLGCVLITADQQADRYQALVDGPDTGAGADGSESAADSGSGQDADTDADSDTDSDSDVDADSDSDTDTDSDTDPLPADDPEVSVLSPAASSSWWLGEQILFEGRFEDDHTAPSDLMVEWASDLDGLLYSGSPDSTGYVAFTAIPSEGTHVLSLTVTDEDLNTTSIAQTITIIDPLAYDNDGDGQTEEEGDCDDGDETIWLGAAEECDEVDNDCDGQNNEDWWDDADAETGADNDSLADAWDLDEVDSDFAWTKDSLEITGLSLHDPGDEDWFVFDVDDDILDNVNLQVSLSDQAGGATWVLELYNQETGVLEDSASGTGRLTVSYSGDWLDDDEDFWAVRVYISTGWSSGEVCESGYTLNISA